MWVDDVLKFWFEEIEPKAWFTKSDAFDEAVRARFSSLRESLMSDQIDVPRTPRGYLAEIIVLDQFSRNLFRDSPRAYESDSKALARAKEAIQLGFDKALADLEKTFLYMPLMHSESLADQELCVELFSKTSNSESLAYAIDHRDIIARFGRFPHRNAILERKSTADEAAFMQTHPGF